MLNNLFSNRDQEVMSEDDAPSISNWLDDSESDGELAIDVYQTRKQIVIKSTIAGVKAEDLKISIHNDLLTIKGYRHNEEGPEEKEYLYKECYWGSFSRSIILTSEVDNNNIDASLSDGVLTIILTKVKYQEISVKNLD